MKTFYILTLLLCTALLQAQSSNKLVIENAKYLDLAKGSFVSGNILIEDGLIKRIDKDKIKESEASKIDASEQFIIPGLIDAHIHLFQSGAIYTRPDVVDLTAYKSYEDERNFLKENATDLLRRYLRCGITSVIDIGGPMYQFDIRDTVKNDPDYPNLFMTGPLITTFDAPAWDIDESPIIRVNSAQESRQLVRDQLAYNPDFIKIWGMPLPGEETMENYDIIMAAIDEAKKHKLKIFVHATRLNGAKMAIRAGADVLVHGVSGWIDSEFSEMLRDSNVVLIPTLVVSRNYSRTLSQDFHPTKEDFEISNPFILGEIFDSEHLIEEKVWEKSIGYYPQVKKSLAINDSNNVLNTELMMRHGNILATGTDAGNIGTLHASSYYDEVLAMSKTGLSNLQVLEASTLNGAKALGKESVLGSISVGKMADLVILEANPLLNLDNLKAVVSVIKAGKIHEAASILTDTPEILVQRQLNAYNAGNIDAFLEPYAEDVEIYSFPDQLQSKGKAKMRPRYADMFEKVPNLHCELVNRIIKGNSVIDHERITGIPGRDSLEAVAIYKIEDNKIAKVYFVR